MRTRFLFIPVVLCLLPLGVAAHAQSVVVTPAAPAAPAADDAQKMAAARHLMALLGMQKMSHQIMDSMFSAMKASGPPVSDTMMAKLRAKFSDDEYINMVAKVYADNYTLSDINGMIAFYQTPLGQKIIATLPRVTQQSMTLGMEWGQKKAAEVMKEMRQEQAGRATKASTQ